MPSRCMRPFPLWSSPARNVAHGLNPFWQEGTCLPGKKASTMKDITCLRSTSVRDGPSLQSLREEEQ
eukprot:12424560-Heterocapsa_arctica.AAC.1